MTHPNHHPDQTNPFVVGAALLSEALGIPRNAGVVQTREALQRAGYRSHCEDLQRVTAYRKGIDGPRVLYPLPVR